MSKALTRCSNVKTAFQFSHALVTNAKRTFSDESEVIPTKKVKVQRLEEVSQDNNTILRSGGRNADVSYKTQPMTVDDVQKKDDDFVNLLNSYLRVTNVPMSPLNKPDMDNAKMEFIGDDMREIKQLTMMAREADGPTKDIILNRLQSLRSLHTTDENLLVFDVDTETVLVEDEVDVPLEGEELEVWRAEQARKKKEAEELELARLEKLKRLAQEQEQYEENRKKFNPYAATTSAREPLRPLRYSMPDHVMDRINELKEIVQKLGFTNPDDLKDLPPINLMPPAEKIRVLKGLKALSELASLIVEWNRSSNTEQLKALKIGEATLDMRPSKEARDFTQFKVKNGDAVSSYFTTDVDLPGREFKFDNVYNLEDPKTEEEPEEKISGGSGLFDVSDILPENEDSNLPVLPQEASTEYVVEEKSNLTQNASVSDPIHNDGFNVVNDVDDIKDDDEVDITSPEHLARLKAQREENSNKNTKIKVNSKALERAKKLINSDSDYLNNALRRGIRDDSIGGVNECAVDVNSQQYQKSVNVLESNSTDAVAARERSKYLNKFSDRFLKKSRPLGKLGSQQIRDILAKHDYNPYYYNCDYLTKEYGISLLSVLEEVKARSNDKIITDMSIGGFSPPVYKVKSNFQISNLSIKIYEDLKKSSDSETSTQQKELIDFMKRMTEPDEYGYIDFLPSDILIPNLPDAKLKPLLDQILANHNPSSFTPNPFQLNDNNPTEEVVSEAILDDHGNPLPMNVRKAGVGSVRPDERHLLNEDPDDIRHTYVENLMLFKGKTLKQLFDLGLFNVSPYDQPINDASENVRGRYAFSDGIYNAMKRTSKNNTEMMEIMYGKHHKKVSDIFRKKKLRSMEKSQHFESVSKPSNIILDEEDDYGISTANTMNTKTLDEKSKPKKTSPFSSRRDLPGVSSSTGLSESEKLKIEQEVIDEINESVFDNEEEVISDFTKLAIGASVMVKYKNHPNVLANSGKNILDETMIHVLKEGGHEFTSDVEFEQFKKDTQHYPIRAFESMLEHLKTPFLTISPEDRGFNSLFMATPYSSHIEGNIQIGYLTPENVEMVHDALIGKNRFKGRVTEPFESAVLPGDAYLQSQNTNTTITFNDTEYAPMSMKYAQLNAVLGVGGVSDADPRLHSSNTSSERSKRNDMNIQIDIEKLNEVLKPKEYVISNLDEILDDDVDHQRDFATFVMDVKVDSDKTKQMLKYSEEIIENHFDITQGIKRAGVFETDEEIEKLMAKKKKEVEMEYVHGVAKTTMGMDIKEAEIQGGEEEIVKEKTSSFDGQTKELFGGPLAVQTYLNILKKNEELKNKNKQE